MELFNTRIIAVVLGIALAWASIFIIGIGAAVPIPAELLKPLTMVSALLAFTLVDLFTIALPLAAAFLIIALAAKLFHNKPDTLFYLLLLAPLVLLQLYLLMQTPEQLFNNVITTLPRYLLLALCLYFLTKSSGIEKDHIQH